MKMKTPPILRTTLLQIGCNWLQTVYQVSSEKKKKTKLATTCCILRPFYLELRYKTMRDFHSVVCRPFLVVQVSVALFEHSIL